MPSADDPDITALEGMAAAFAADELVLSVSGRHGVHEIAFRLQLLEARHKALRAYADTLVACLKRARRSGGQVPIIPSPPE